MLSLCIIHVVWTYAAMTAHGSLKGDARIMWITLFGVEGS